MPTLFCNLAVADYSIVNMLAARASNLVVAVLGCQQRKVLAVKADAIEVIEIRIASGLATAGEKVEHAVLLVDTEQLDR